MGTQISLVGGDLQYVGNTHFEGNAGGDFREKFPPFLPIMLKCRPAYRAKRGSGGRVRSRLEVMSSRASL